MRACSLVSHRPFPGRLLRGAYSSDALQSVTFVSSFAQAVFAISAGLQEVTSSSPVKHGDALHVQYEPSDLQQ